MAFAHRSPSTKRILREVKELAKPTYDYVAYPLEDNLFEWHFTIRGPEGTEFEGGIYHGVIRLPPEYPLKPPAILFLTPNGRFKVNDRVCLSISDYHPETWQPAWTIRTVLVALIAFLPTPGRGAVGSIDCAPAERRKLARQSVKWTCSECGHTPSHDLERERKHRSADDEEANRVASQLLAAEAKEADQKKKEGRQEGGEKSNQEDTASTTLTTTAATAAASESQSASDSTPSSSSSAAAARSPATTSARRRAGTGDGGAEQQHTQAAATTEASTPETAAATAPSSSRRKGGQRRSRTSSAQTAARPLPPPDTRSYDIIIAGILIAILALLAQQWLSS
ncbi:hypothetical protein PTSG_04132 [Salpingoeca rosetta]|uniref:UBC core domain-containing protein n=1 Tax=Salpingoeca rosetta (strain ATCC 50818 / BSB-021) TaxID=946362 RepID=F2U6P1_SALR5|nr:uncharacterized protein PTSG_04132 [Salpingoeca rosetta]EGD83523.1 hypothetical protein PTSG_04132 [Salpingoeca rosetta]|eukprot:XP_004995027.1 hypothetical protein PTSG_04132 [Salpingoeca rosetta]